MGIATIKGVWVRPGMSKNGRLYTPGAIAGAVTEAQRRIDSGGAALAVLTHHGARDPRLGDVTATAGRLTKVGLDANGNGTFEAELADTQAGRDVAALVTPEHPFLKGVSMAANWTTQPRTIATPTGPAETADGFSLRGIDLTHIPGVPGAEIHTAVLHESAGGSLIFESLDHVVMTQGVSMSKPSLTEAQLQEVQQTFHRNGNTASVRSGVAKQYHLDESLVAKLGAVFTESAADGTYAQRSPDADAVDAAAVAFDDRKRVLADQLAAGANRAAQDLRGASISDLESFAALSVGPLAWK